MHPYLFIFCCLSLVGTSLSASLPHHHHLKEETQLPSGSKASVGSPTAHENVPDAQIITALRNTAQVKPVAYLPGNGEEDLISYRFGDVITSWATNPSSPYPPVLQGGMTYENGYITVPETGIYFIYVLLYSQLPSGEQANNAFPNLNVDSKQIGLTQLRFTSTTDTQSQYLGVLWKVNAGSRIFVKAASMDYWFGRDGASFGAYRVD